MADIKEPLIPKIGVVTDIRIDTPDVKTFRVVTPDGKKLSSICPVSAQCFPFPVWARLCSQSHLPPQTPSLWSFQ